MKRLELTPELLQLIKDRVGEDVNLDGIAVFETITLNTKPLPGKKGSLWEGATATPLTLRQIADHINNGGHIPLVLNHNLEDMPTGRVFKAGLDYAEDGSFELRTLFYLDASDEGRELAGKIDAGSLDEVSISFLPTSYLCSECGWDYLGEDAEFVNLITRTCANDHTVGTDGVHVSMVGLATLIELSLVARGAAANPKIVGRSASKLAPASAQRLAARGFEPDRLVCQASRGEDRVNTEKLVADLVAAQTEVGVLKAAAETHDTALQAANSQVEELTTKLTAAEADVARLTGELETAKEEAGPSEGETEATTWLTASLTKLLTAAGKPVENLPEDVAGLTAAIDAETKGLTALIPAGGKSQTGADLSDDEAPKASLSAFKSAPSNRR
jgi:hypothetical protein